ncbi:unnamed protein product [Closterium sp. NIES-54]
MSRLKSHRALYDAVVARYSSPATAALGRLLLPYLIPELSAFATVADLVTHLRTSDAHYRPTVPAEFLATNQAPMFITLYFIVSRLPHSLCSVMDHFLSLDPTSLTVDLLEQHLLAAETSAVSVGAARGNPRPPFFEGCSPSPLFPSFASATAANVSVPEDVGAASTSAKCRSSKGKGGRGGGGGNGGGGGGSGSGGGGSGGGGGGSGGGGGGGTSGGSGGSAGGGGGSGGSGGSGGGRTGGGRSGPRTGGHGGDQRQQQQRRSKTQSPQQLREWLVQRGTGGGSEACPYVIRMGVRAGQTCGKFHTEHRCFSRLDDARRAEFGDDIERPRWTDLLRLGVAIFDLDYDAIISAMYALSFSAKGDCYRCVPPDPGIAAAALGASASSTPPGTAPAEALHTFTLDSSASCYFFRDSTTLTPLPAPVPVRLADLSKSVQRGRSRHCPFLHCPPVSGGSVRLTIRSSPPFVLYELREYRCPSGCDGHYHHSWRSACVDLHVHTDGASPGYVHLSARVESIHAGYRASSGRCICSGFRVRSGSCLLLVSPPVALDSSMAPPPRSPLPAKPSWHALPVSRLWSTQRAAPHSSSFPPMTAPLQTLHMGMWGPARVSGQGRERYFLLVVDDYTRYTTVFSLRSKGEVPDVLIPWIRTVRLQIRERFGTDLPVLRLHSDRGGEFSSDLLRDFCRGEGITQSFTLPDSPQQNGIAERRIGLLMEVARTSMIHAAAPHFLWPFAVRYTAHQLNLWPRVSLRETSQTLRWTGKVGDASVFRSVPFYRLFPYCSAPPPPPPLFLAPGPPPVDPLPPQGPSPSGVSQLDPLPGTTPVQVAVGSGAALCAASGGVASGGAASGGAEPGGPADAWPRLSSQQLHEWLVRRAHRRSGAPGAGGAGDTGAGGAAVPVGAGGTECAATTGPGGARTSGAGAAETGGVGSAGAGDPTEPGAAGAGGARAGGAGVRGPGARGAGAAGGGAVDPGAGGAGGAVQLRPYFIPLHQQPASPLPATSPYTEQLGGLTERREPASRPVSRVRTAYRAPCLRPPPVPCTHTMALRPSSVPLRVPLPAPPESSLPEVPDPASYNARTASPTVARLLATTVNNPSLESASAFAPVAELLDFAASCRLDYATALVVESVSASPPSVGGECALGTDILEDRQEDFECLVAAVPRFASMLLAPKGDLDAPDIPTPRSSAEAITGPYSSQWQAAMDAEIASWKSTGTYLDEVFPSRTNIVDGMWIFMVKRPPGSPPAFKARYVARGFSQRQGVDYFQTFSPTPKMTTLRVLLHVAAQRDYELHSLDFSTSFLQGSLHEEIWLRRPRGFTGTFPAGTQWSLWRPVYGLRQAPHEWHDTLRTTLAALGFAPSTADPSLFLRTDTTLPPFYVLVYVDDLLFATADTETLTLVKSELQKRHTCTDLGELRSYLGLQITRNRARRTITLTQSHMVHQVLQRFGFQFSSPQPTPLSTSHSLSAPPSDESVEPSGPYPELVGCLMYLMTCTRPDLAYPLSLLARYVAPSRHRNLHWDDAKRVLRYLCSTSGMGLVLGGRGPGVLTGHADASRVDDSATQRSSQGYTFSLGSGSVSWPSTRSSSVLSSSCEAEIYAGAMAAQELHWLTYLLTDLGEQPRSPLALYLYNKAMIALCQEHRLEHGMKHIALRYFLARELQQRGQLRLAYVATRANTTDVFTKALPLGDHQRFATVLVLVPTLPHLLTA